MKSGQTLAEIATEVRRQSETKADYIVPTRMMSVHTDTDADGVDRATHLRFNTVGAGGGIADVDAPLTDLAHRHMAQYLKIPADYYDRMRADAPELLDDTITTWLQHRNDARMVRTLDGRTRALASRSYRPLDNIDMLAAVVPVLQELGGPGMADLRVESSGLTERKLYLKIVSPRLEGEVRKGDIVQAGLAISNSEVLDGSVNVQPLIYRLVCTNGMIANDYGIRKSHVGRAAGDLDASIQWYRDETREADDRVLWMKVADVVRGTLTDETFQQILERMRVAAGITIKDPVAVVENVSKQYTFTEEERTSVLEHLITGADLSAYGLSNAITRTSQDVPSYDRATQLERVGGQIIELDPREWRVLGKAA